MLADAEILIEARLGTRHAAVRRDDIGRLWLTVWTDGDERRVAGSSVDGASLVRIAGQGWMAVGGHAPAEAELVDVREGDSRWHPASVSARARAWVAIAPTRDEPLPPAVRFRTAAGEIVSSGPAAWLARERPLEPRERLVLAAARGGVGGICPVCGNSEWRATDEDAGTFVFCRTCGHTDGLVHRFPGPAT